MNLRSTACVLFLPVLLLLFCGLVAADEADLVWSTFLGGSSDDWGEGIALDSDGNAYVTGYTWSVDFPTTAGAFDETYNGGSNTGDAFVAKLNATGSALGYATFLGGSLPDGGYRIALDSDGNAYVTGHTGSYNFPLTAGALDTTHDGVTDAFVAKFNPTGSALAYSTLIGGSAEDWGAGIALDGSGNAYVTGGTRSSNFPTTTEAFDTTYNGEYDAFVTKLDLSGYPVPVVLASFTATSSQGFIALNWVTASEINCHRWEIYRSDREDGEYARIGELSGHGSTETDHTYQWVDRQIRPEVSYYYKLKQVDFDGSSWWSHSVSATATATVPKSYTLHQNYPNPFNPATEISYAIPRDEHVTLKVYNVLGAEVANLVDGHQRANFYTVRWDAGDLASGLYFCRLQAGGFSKSIKMILLK